jgi:hypothetical protein
LTINRDQHLAQSSKPGLNILKAAQSAGGFYRSSRKPYFLHRQLHSSLPVQPAIQRVVRKKPGFGKTVFNFSVLNLLPAPAPVESVAAGLYAGIYLLQHCFYSP